MLEPVVPVWCRKTFSVVRGDNVEKLIISAAVVGAELTKKETPYLPLTPSDIAEEACRCYEAGAVIIHLHARDREGQPTQDAAVYKEIISLIKERCNPIIQISTGGAIGMTAEERLAPLKLKPDMASLTVGTINFGDDVFYNSPKMIVQFAAAMKEAAIKPEFEVFDVSMVTNVRRLAKQGLIKTPFHFDFVLGVPGGIPATIKNLLFLQESLPEGSTWSAAGIGRHQLPMACSAILLGGHSRVGLEDNIYYRKGELAQGNVPLVKRVVRLANELNREVANVDEARRILGLL